jgi:hypothetical protein
MFGGSAAAVATLAARIAVTTSPHLKPILCLLRRQAPTALEIFMSPPPGFFVCSSQDTRLKADGHAELRRPAHTTGCTSPIPSS